LMFEFLKPEPVQRLLENHRSGRSDNHKLLFSLVMFEEWLRAIQLRQGVKAGLVDRQRPLLSPIRSGVV
jgi:hypothetical protein